MALWFATGNSHKKMELAAILSLSAAEVCIPADAGLEFDPEETGSAFYENALIKARALHTLLNEKRPPLFNPGDPVIADDSGLCVDALGGRPGIFSARYAGKNAPPLGAPPLGKKLEQAERNALLLEELGSAAPRSCRFVCAMALMLAPDRFFLAQETVEGEIVARMEAAQGTRGFGYDPIFYLPHLGRTMAELGEEEKNAISHRGKAGKIIGKMLNNNYNGKIKLAGRT